VAANTSDAILKQVQTLFGAGAVGLLTDGQLLERFIAQSETAESAFETLVERHGPMVLSVCQSTLGDWHEAQDAFQATFLVLARNARSVRKGDSVGSWLFGVASRVSARARRLAVRRRLKERRRAAMNSQHVDTIDPPNLLPELYEELNRLPEKYRAPIVLCHLEGQTCEQAASQLQWPIGTVQSRLARGRERLRARLIRRGLAPSAGALAAALAPKSATAAVLPPVLISSTAQAAMRIAAGKTATASVSTSVAGLVHDFQRSMLMTRVTLVVMSIMVVGLAATAAGVIGVEPAEEPKPAEPSKAIHVRVVNARGEGARDVDVHIRRFDSAESTVKTDANGRALIARETFGDDSALIARGRETLGWASNYGTTVARPKGTENDPLILTLQPLTRKVIGTVVDTAGKPIPGVPIRVDTLLRNDNGGLLLRTGKMEREDWPGSQSITDASGRYTIVLPAETRASFSARHPRYIGPEIICAETATSVETTTLEPAGGIAGTVVDATTGKPVPGASVGAQLLDHHERILNGSWGETTTDDQGRYLIGGLEPGVYNVLFLPHSANLHYTAAAVEAVRVNAGEDARADLKRIVGRRLRGTVSELGTHKPVAGVPMGYYGTARPRSGAAIIPTKTDERGNFEFFVPPGPAYVYIATMGANDQTLVVPEDRDPDPITIRSTPRSSVQRMYGAMPAPTTAVELPPTPKEEANNSRMLTGRILDPDGKPLAGAGVSYSNNQKFRMVATDREGVFVLNGLPAGEVAVSIQKDQYKGKDEQIEANQDKVEFVLGRLPAPAPRPVAKATEPRDPNVAFLDLQPLGTDGLVDGPGGSGNDLGTLPLGEQKLEDLWFNVGELMIHLQGQNERDMPEKVEGIKINSAFKSLYLLHATQQAVASGTEIGAYVVNYADGSHERIPIVYGKDLCNWWDFQTNEFPSNAIIAWQGKNREGPDGRQVRLFARTWENPHPTKVVETIDVESSITACDPFVVALTIEKK
jgi:RNA polymerase sigma factor (sigma-70 family)